MLYAKRVFTKNDMEFYLDWAVIKAKGAMMNAKIDVHELLRAEPIIRQEIMSLMTDIAEWERVHG